MPELITPSAPRVGLLLQGVPVADETAILSTMAGQRRLRWSS